jgi:lipid-A-disaccharide synthase
MVAGEPSGDAQGARLAAALLRQEPTLELYGVGGRQMARAGVRIDVDSEELSIMGLSEAVSGLSRARRILATLKEGLSGAQAPDVVVPIDFPDFNLRLAKAAHSRGVKVFYYISPQVWAWRRGRIKQICRNVDRMIVLFPFEEELFRERGLDVHFVGHPLAEDVKASRSKAETRSLYGLPQDSHVVALLPGSRKKEVESMLPSMLEAVRLLGPGVCAAIAKAPSLSAASIAEPVAASGCDVKIVEDDTYNLVAASDAVLVTSGTATVECALLGCPTVVAYRMSRLTYALARRLVKVPFIAMPNLVMGRAVVPELVQDEATPERMAKELAVLLEDGEPRRQMVEDLAGLHSKLVLPGAADRAAGLLLDLMNR